jgi:hypothetical protein
LVRESTIAQREINFFLTPGQNSSANSGNAWRTPVARHAYPLLDNSLRLADEMRKRVAPDHGAVWKMRMWSPGMALRDCRNGLSPVD